MQCTEICWTAYTCEIFQDCLLHLLTSLLVKGLNNIPSELSSSAHIVILQACIFLSVQFYYHMGHSLT